MALTLYELGGLQDRRYSQFSWRTRLALAHKGLAVEYRPVRVSDKAAIAFSGQKNVPILVDGDTTVVDSWRIAEYLEETYADRPSLFGGAVGLGLARFVNAWVDRQVILAAVPLVVCDVVDCVDTEDAAHLRAYMEKAFRTTFEAMREQRAERKPAFKRLLDPARAALKAQPFLSGAAPAYPDYILFSVFQWARIIGTFELLEEDDPMAAWRERMLDLFDGLGRRAAARQ
jgi:glutathione S-transferase